MASELFNIVTLPVVIALSVLAERLVQWFVRPIFDRQQWDTFWLAYVGLGVGGALSLLCSLNLFSIEIMPSPVGQIVTAFLCGGGSNLINQLTSRTTPAELKMVATPQSVTMTATGEGQAPAQAIKAEDARPVAKP